MGTLCHIHQDRKIRSLCRSYITTLCTTAVLGQFLNSHDLSATTHPLMLTFPLELVSLTLRTLPRWDGGAWRWRTSLHS